MKTRNLFAFAMATMAFAACSNDDDQAGIAGGGQKGDLIDAIGISFAAPGTPTYADSGTKEGEGEEDNIYKAFIFAYQAGQKDLMPGDWSVKEVGDGTSVIPASGTDTDKKYLNNMETFEKVRMGDNVYVLANVPGLTLAELTAVAHNGENSEKKIQEFIHNVSKEYLNGLAYQRKDGVTPTGHFVMAGKASIPTNPTTPNNETVTVPVELNREMAKVSFQAVVTSNQDKEACGRVELTETDGIIIARVAKRLSPFSTLDSYFPTDAKGADKDWGFDTDNKDTWLIAFDGDKYDKVASPATEAIKGTQFNIKAFNDKAQEYRFTWMHTADDATRMLEVKRDKNNPTGLLLSPYFYVSPNYSGDPNCVTVIATQATYVGAPVFKDANAQKLFTTAFDLYLAADTQTKLKKNDTDAATTFDEVIWNDDAMAYVAGYFASTGLAAITSDLEKASGLNNADVSTAAGIINGVAKNEANAALNYFTGQKLYYRADIANYDASNTISDNITKRNTFYQIEGTISSLGAKTIEDAINSDNISMQVVVKVMPWTWVINRPEM